MCDRANPDRHSGPVRRAVTIAAVLCAAAGTAACTATGDLGRPRPVALSFDPLLAGGQAASPGQPPLTDDERELRRRAWAFLTPTAEEAAAGGTVSGYAAWLLATPFSSSEARYARIDSDLDADIARLGELRRVAARVLSIDRARTDALAYIPGLAKAEMSDAAGRVAENRSLVKSAEAAMARRLAAYRHALERLAIATPSRAAAGVERRLMDAERSL